MNVKTPPSSEGRRWPGWAVPVGTLFLGVVGSGLWDVVAKPGLSSFGRFVLSVVALGSSRLADLAYASAALDPYPVASVAAVTVGAGFLIGVAGGVLVFSVVFRRADRLDQDGSGSSYRAAERHRLARMTSARQRLKRLSIAFVVLLHILGLAAYVVTSVLSQAVLIRRVFEADLRIISPFLTEAEEERFRARFAGLSTRAEYQRVAAKMRQVASMHGAKLRPEDLW